MTFTPVIFKEKIQSQDSLTDFSPDIIEVDYSKIDYSSERPPFFKDMLDRIHETNATS